MPFPGALRSRGFSVWISIWQRPPLASSTCVVLEAQLGEAPGIQPAQELGTCLQGTGGKEKNPPAVLSLIGFLVIYRYGN